jgi:hypothetical protein
VSHIVLCTCPVCTASSRKRKLLIAAMVVLAAAGIALLAALWVNGLQLP